MTRKLRLKRTISGITAAIMIFAAVPTTPAYAESGATSYSFDGYDVEYSVKNEWSDGKTIEVKITNTSDESILNWAFKYDAEGKVNDLWNASVYSADNTSYIIKNDGWNYEIAPAASVLFGYKLTEFSDNNPNSFILCSKRVDKTDGYDVQYNITKEWDIGLQGEIVISNTSDEPLEAWELSFDSTFEINNLWDGRIISSEDGHYVIASEMWTNPIDVGGTKIIGFTGTKKNTDEQSISNYNLSVVIIDSEASNSGTGGNGGNDEPEPTPEPEIDITKDTDGDKLPDVYEDMYGTDKENPDTDSDGLTDYEEITLTGTDPLVYDSVTEGVSDEDADYDDDGLTTREEMTLGTDPTQADTDNDRINDYDEINVWHTVPLVADTDKDDIVDGDEVKIGLDPTNPETFGYPDIEYKSTQHIDKDSISLSSINYEDNDIFTYSVDVTSNGYVEPYMYARKSCYTSVMQNDFMIGIAPELVYLGEYGIDNIKVSFTVSDEYIEKTKVPEETKEEFLSKINIFRYFESANALLPVETTRDAETGTLSTESNAVTTYCLMNMDAWVNMLKEYAQESDIETPKRTLKATPKLLKNYEEAVDEDDSMIAPDDFGDLSIDVAEEDDEIIPSFILKSSNVLRASANTKTDYLIDAIFVVQAAGLSKTYYQRQLRVIDETAEKLFNYCNKVRVAVIGYKCKSTFTTVEWCGSQDSFHAKIEALRDDYTSESQLCDRGAAFKAIIEHGNLRPNANKFVMHFVNGNTTANKLIDHITLCKDNAVNVSEFVPYGFHYVSSEFEKRVKDAIKSTNGIYRDVENVTASICFNHIKDNLVAPETRYKALVPNNWTIIELKSPLVPGGNTDTDGDTLSDWDEVNHDLLKWDATGHVQQMSVEEFIKEVTELSLDNSTGQFANVDMWAKSLTCIPLISDPTNLDGDGDGIEDKDEFKWNGLDPRYAHNSPLKKDTVETLYPQLSLSLQDGTNSVDNPVYLYIEDNNIKIVANVFFTGSYDKLVPQAKANGMTMKDAFKEGIKNYWSGTNLGNYYDFMKGMTINVSVVICGTADKKGAISVYFSDRCNWLIPSYVTCNDYIVAGGLWTTKRVKTVYINPCTNLYHLLSPSFCEDCYKYAETIRTHGGDALLYFEYSCAHEFGHVLGLWDAYGNDSSNNGYSITENDNADKDKKEFQNLNIMRSRHEELKKGHDLVPSNEIEMMLQAFEYNNWQYYYQGHCEFWGRDIHQTISSAIKSPILTYEKDLGGGNYSYYYINRDISNNMHQVTSKSSFPAP